jgi:hypothetical protein
VPELQSAAPPASHHPLLTQMPRPSGSQERRLAVLLSHFHPCCEPPRTIPGVASAECLGTAAAAEAETEGSLSTSPCAGGEEKGESSGGGHCVFCNIVAGTAQAFKVSMQGSQLVQPFCV